MSGSKAKLHMSRYPTCAIKSVQSTRPLRRVNNKSCHPLNRPLTQRWSHSYPMACRKFFVWKQTNNVLVPKSVDPAVHSAGKLKQSFGSGAMFGGGASASNVDVGALAGGEGSAPRWVSASSAAPCLKFPRNNLRFRKVRLTK